MTHTRQHPDDAHPCERRGEAEQYTQCYVSHCTRVLAAFDQADSLHAEGRKSRESAAESNHQECPQVVVGLDVHELANEDANQETAGDIHEQSAEREPMRSKVLDPAADQIAEHGTRGASNCDE